MADEIRIKNVQAEVRDEAVPALVDAANAVLDAFVSDCRAAGTERTLTLGTMQIHRNNYADGQSFYIRVSVEKKYGLPDEPVGLRFWQYAEPLYLNTPLGWSWGKRYSGRVPTAGEVDLAAQVIAIIAEHYAVGEWAKKGKGTIHRLKAVHRALTE